MEVNPFAAVDTSDPYRALKQTNREWLAFTTKVRRDMLARSTLKLRYSCPEEIVLFEGVTVETKIEHCQFPPMKLGNCFANAMLLTLHNPELRYCEGFALMEQSMPTHHAWVMHPDGSVSDPTWLSLIHDIREGKRGGTIEGWDGRCVYIGVTVPRLQHFGWMLKHETMNLLSYGDMTRREVLEHGPDAWAEFEIAPDQEQSAIEQIEDMLCSAPKWELSEDQTHYVRRDRDGNITDRWYGENTNILKSGVQRVARA